MKKRGFDYKDDWATPEFFYNDLNNRFGFDFDPCPYQHDLDEWDGLAVEWGNMNFVNPPYSRKLKEAFVKKALLEREKGKRSVLLLPVSTSTTLFHDFIYPNASGIEFVRRRIPFIGINSKGDYVNWHMWERTAPKGVVHVKNSGMHDSMIVIF